MNPERVIQFQDVTAATVRAVSEDPDLVVGFNPGSPGIAAPTVTIDKPSSLDVDADINRIRGQADEAALWLRHHDDAITRLTEPVEAEAKALFKALEKVRCDSLGARTFDGIASNLQAHFCHEYTQSPLLGSPHTHPQQLSTALVVLAREVLGGFPSPPEASDVFISWRQHLAGHLDHFYAMAKSLGDQAGFAKHARELLRALGFPGITPDDANPELQQAPLEVHSNALSECSHATGKMGNDAATRVSFETLHQNPSNTASDAMQHMDDSTAGDRSTPTAPDKSHGQRSEYKIFTTEFDEIVDAGSQCERKELIRLRTQLDEHIGKLSGVVGHLAKRLQHRLLAKQNRDWEFDLDEGILDSARLSRVVVNPFSSLSFKHEKEIELRDTVVTCLIDNSGSMRGRPIRLAAIAADMMARTLERCGVKVEILGFTTRAWKGGRARERWLAAGRPSQPGRLNDLRHIVYKPADTPWLRARLGFGLMLREPILKENIDGEALAWAYARLMSRLERRKILIVVSDGAPVDDATLSANSGSFLEDHLRHIIAMIEDSRHVELTAIGIVHDVTSYYRRAVTLVDADQLGGAITDELAELLDPSPANRRKKH